MEPDTRYTIIGAAVLALTAAAILGYLWLSRVGSQADYRFYTVYFVHQSLEGLQVGGSVNMRGITVGRVEDYEIDSHNINRVRVVLRVARETPVRQNTVATISRNIVTGIARVNLVTPGVPGPELVKVAEGERYPVIPEGTSGTEQITDAVNRLATVADQTLRSANQVLGPENQKAFAELLAQTRDLAKGLNQRLATVDRVALEIEASSAAFRKASADIAQAARRVADTAEPLSRDAGAALREATTALQALTTATRSIERDLSATLQRLDKDTGMLARRADDSMDIGVLELRATAADLRTSADAIARTLDRLREPRAALIGPDRAQLGPGEGGR